MNGDSISGAVTSVYALRLPDAPASFSGPVKAREEDVSIFTYLPAEPYLNPMLLEKRVYQGSRGRVYPLPFIDRIATEPHAKRWKAVHIENKFLRLMALPQIGEAYPHWVRRDYGLQLFVPAKCHKTRAGRVSRALDSRRRGVQLASASLAGDFHACDDRDRAPSRRIGHSLVQRPRPDASDERHAWCVPASPVFCA